jgi:hypothetical protein
MSSLLFTWRCELRDRDERHLDPADRLTSLEVDVLLGLTLDADPDTLEVAGGCGKLGRVLVRDPKTVRCALRSLERKGWCTCIERVKGGDPTRVNRYRLTIPADYRSRTRIHYRPETRSAAADLGLDTRRVRVPDPQTTGGTPDEEVRGSGVVGGGGTNEGEPLEFREVMASINGAEPRGPQRQRFLDAYRAAPAGWKRLMEMVKQSPKANNRWALADYSIKNGGHLKAEEQATKATTIPPCPECEVGGGQHIDGCSLAPKAEVVT